MSDKFAVVTVSSDDFALGSAVALASFRQSNRWFSGETVVIATDLSDDRRALIRAAGPTEFRAPSNELLRRIDALCDARPELRTRRLRFCSLESFALAGYDKVLFLDSDTVVSGDFEELFRRPEPFIAAPDKPTLIGKRRDRTSFESVDANEQAGLASFNAGMMLIGHDLLDGTVYADLLDLLEPDAWKGVKTDHTDQLVLNRRLAPQTMLVDPLYNLPVGHRIAAQLLQGRSVEEVCMFHFNGPRKPWKPDHIVERAIDDPVVGCALAKWHRAFERMVAEARLGRLATSAG